MKVIKCINNNVAICLDSNGKEVVAFGKGVGFKKPPNDIELSQVDRTYYDIDNVYISMINDIDPEVIAISDQIVQYATEKLDTPISSNIVFTLADHIDFAIKRYRENMAIKLPIIQDIKYLFETEMDIGKYALKLIKNKKKIWLPEEEASYIALHIINSKSFQKKDTGKFDEDIIDDIIAIINKHFDIAIETSGFNYSRFVSHMHYLLKRGQRNELLETENSVLYESLKTTFPDTYACSEKIRSYLNIPLKRELTDEECMYLILHVNRLCAREDCNQ